MDNSLPNKTIWKIVPWMWVLMFGIFLSLIGPGQPQGIYILYGIIAVPIALGLAVTLATIWEGVMDMIDKKSAG